MSTPTRREYFSILRERYRRSLSKTERSRIIEEAVFTSGLHRKSVIRVLNQKRSPEGGVPQLGRKRRYGESCIGLLKEFYRKSGYVCSDVLKSMIPELLLQLNRPIDATAKSEIDRISPATMDRYLRKYRGIERRRRNTTTRPGSIRFRALVPVKSLGNIAGKPGHLQTDTVSHGGESSSGVFAYSLTVTDEKCGWTENRGVWGKFAKNVLPAIQSSHEALPFDLVTMNVDNGSEFLNWAVYEYFKFLGEKKVIPFPMTRSRPYKKNDNCHVEQKNWTHVRSLFGYDRLDDEELIPHMNEIYRVHNLIENYFIPKFKLLSKVRVGAKIKKKYDKPKTPYQRLLEDLSVTEEQKQKLRNTYSQLNYFDLVEQREELLSRFEALKKELKSKKSG